MSTMEITRPTSVPTRWNIDPSRSSVEFAVKTFWGTMTVRGRFERFDGWYDVTADHRSVELWIEAESLNTGNGRRDAHLRSPDFFAAADHPYVRFASTRIRDAGDGKLHVEGHLEAAGVLVPLELDATLRTLDGELVVEADTSVDPRRFGMSRGHLAMIQPRARLHVKARLTPTTAHDDQAPPPYEPATAAV
jgi:polyisoprenoid-binding protein YceI